jgi:hypothetical protein
MPVDVVDEDDNGPIVPAAPINGRRMSRSS